EKSVEQVGCIHTCQGLEFDYVGVILGEDLGVRDGRVVTCVEQRAGQDRSVHGYKKLHKEQPESESRLPDHSIKNSNRTLLTKGQKGCYLYPTDQETRDYFASFVRPQDDIVATPLTSPLTGLSLPVVPHQEALPFELHVPIYDL